MMIGVALFSGDFAMKKMGCGGSAKKMRNGGVVKKGKKGKKSCAVRNA